MKVLEPVLYILMRSDIKSMNPGKAAAHAAHAANAFVKSVHIRNEDELNDLLRIWEAQAGTFGTTIVLDGGSQVDIEEVVKHKSIQTGAISSGMVFDPTYPVSDGKLVHTIPLHTCGWMFGDRNSSKLKKLLDKKQLY